MCVSVCHLAAIQTRHKSLHHSLTLMINRSAQAPRGLTCNLELCPTCPNKQLSRLQLQLTQLRRAANRSSEPLNKSNRRKRDLQNLTLIWEQTAAAGGSGVGTYLSASNMATRTVHGGDKKNPVRVKADPRVWDRVLDQVWSCSSVSRISG